MAGDRISVRDVGSALSPMKALWERELDSPLPGPRSWPGWRGLTVALRLLAKKDSDSWTLCGFWGISLSRQEASALLQRRSDFAAGVLTLLFRVQLSSYGGNTATRLVKSLFLPVGHPGWHLEACCRGVRKSWNGLHAACWCFS